MSRSYKHTPYAGDKKGKEKKRIANKTVRNKLKHYYAQLSRQLTRECIHLGISAIIIVFIHGKNIGRENNVFMCGAL